MARKNGGYIHDIDQLISDTSLDSVLTHYGQPPPSKTSGEHRMHCVFDESCVDSPYGNLTVKLDDAANRIFCHSCRIRGNLLTLIHGLEHRQPPQGGRLRGDEFKQAVAQLRLIAGESNNDATANSKPTNLAIAPAPKRASNTPLHRHEKEAARAIADLCDDLVTDPALMSPAAASYLRKRPWLTEEVMNEWGVGWIPGNGRSLFRKNYFVYTHRNERGEVVSYSGRDLGFDTKWQQWVRHGKEDGKKPFKHRYVAGYRKGVELYGGQASRLKEPCVQQSLAKLGVVVCEGMNEVMRMATLDVAAVGLTSNRATEEQIEKLVRFIRTAGDNRALLLPDCDEEGEAGFKELLWRLCEQDVDVQLGCSRRSFDGAFANRQPEDFSDEEWGQIESCLRT